MPKRRVAQAQARLVQAEQDLARIRPFSRLRPSAEKMSDDAVAETLAAKAALEGARSDLVKAKFDLDNTLITAPVDGRIGRSQFYEGRLVSAQTTLLTTIDQLDPMYVNVSVPESYLLRRRRELAEHKVERPDIFQLRGVMTFSDGSVYPEKAYWISRMSPCGPRQGRYRTRSYFPIPKVVRLRGNPIFTLGSSSRFASRATSEPMRSSSRSEPFSKGLPDRLYM